MIARRRKTHEVMSVASCNLKSKEKCVQLQHRTVMSWEISFLEHN